MTYPIPSDNNSSVWYSEAADYWKNVEPTVEGMLGGFADLDSIDVQSSSSFILPLIKSGQIQTRTACDGGAGIGRVAKNFLSKHFDSVDLVEQDAHFINTAKHDVYLQPYVKRFINCGLQDFDPERYHLTYDVVWCQWVLGHLTDPDLTTFFKRIRAIAPILCIKENVASGNAGEVEIDTTDFSLTRSEKSWKARFMEGGWTILKEEWQENWPKRLYRVKTWCLKHSS